MRRAKLVAGALACVAILVAWWLTLNWIASPEDHFLLTAAVIFQVGAAGLMVLMMLADRHDGDGTAA